MASGVQKAFAEEFVLDLRAFQLICSGRPINIQKTPMEILALLACKPGAVVTRDEIVGAIWGDKVHVDVDAGINTAIRKIRQALGDNPASPRYVETVVGRGYRLIGPIQVITSNAPTVPAAPAVPAPLRIPRAAMMAAGLLAVVVALVPWIGRHPRAVSGAPQGPFVIGVVPMRNLSDDPAQAYFAEGLTEEVLTQLGQLNPGQLRVVRYVMPVPAQADSTVERHPVQYLLLGSVRHDGNRARISVSLLRVSDRTTVWTDSFDRQLSDVLLLQSEIAQNIGHQLQMQVLGRSVHQPTNPEVIEAYLHGRFELAQHVVPDAARAYFERAIALDPLYAASYAGLADFYRSRAILNDEGSQEAWRQAEQAAAQALVLDPDSAEAHTAIAQIKLMHEWNWPAAREHAQRALQLNPSSPDAHAVYARYLRIAGHIPEDLDQRRQALALDPLRPDLKQQLVLEYYFARDFQDMVTAARQALSADPNNVGAHSGLCINLGWLKLFSESAIECGKELVLEGHEDWASQYMQMYHRRGYEAAQLWVAARRLNEMLKQPHPDSWDLANAYALADRRPEAMRTLVKGLQTHEPGLLQIRVDPDFDSIRSEPEYAELVRRIGFPTD